MRSVDPDRGAVDLLAARADRAAEAGVGIPYDFRGEATRRDFLQVLGAGLVVGLVVESALAQPPGPGAGRRGGGAGGRGAATLSARVHVGADGILTVMTGKVECGQGARAELTQAAAEELRVPVDRIRLEMADTALVPDDGGTYGSLTTPASVPPLRKGCAACRDLLVDLAVRRFGEPARACEVRAGKVTVDPDRSVSYADLAIDEAAARAFAAAVPADVRLTPVERFELLGRPLARPNGGEIVRGAHEYPSDIVRPGMLHGKILRPPSFGAKLAAIDLAPARAIEGVVVIRDGDFVGVAAPSTWIAQQAIDALADEARWEAVPHPASADLFASLREHKILRPGQADPSAQPFRTELAAAKQSAKRTYEVAYVQHAPLEPRAAVAEWADGRLTVWTGTQVPFGVRNELARAFGLADDRVRVIVPDFGGGFGGKHSGESAVEAARLAQAAGVPVRLVWTRAEEFTWAQFRPAAVIDAEASLDAAGMLTSWRFVNLNSGAAEVDTPYRVGPKRCEYVACSPPLRHGSYRGLAATANNFARESFMDELAELAGRDPLAFRLAHLSNPRIAAVLQAVADRADWAGRARRVEPNVGLGLACGQDKGSVVAACVEVAVDPTTAAITVRRATQAYECGKILNPTGLRAQVEGAIVQGLGPALREAIEFAGGKITNATFGRYLVPRFADVPELDILLLDRPDLPSAGAGETPLIAVAPAIANAVRAATGVRVRSMPIRLPEAATSGSKVDA